MRILEYLGLAPKKRPEAPLIGEKKKQQEQTSSLRRNIYARIGIILGFLIILFLSIPHPSFKDKAAYKVGAPWKDEDLTAPFTFPIKKSNEELKNEKTAIRNNMPPIFYRNPNVTIHTEARLDSLFQNLQPAMQAYKKWKENEAQSQPSSTKDSLNFIQRLNAADINLSDKARRSLLENYETTEIQHAHAETKTAPSTQFIADHLQKHLHEIIKDVFHDGIIDRPKDEVPNNEITLRDLQKRTEQTLNTANVRDVHQASQYAQYQLSKVYFSNITQIGIEIFNQVIAPNLTFNAEKTQDQIDEQIAEISTTKGAVAQGQVIIRKGDIVTQQKYNILQSLASVRAQNASKLERWLRYGGDVLAIIAIVIIFFFYLYLYRRSIFMNNDMLLLVLLTMSIICVASSLVYQLNSISLYIVPVAIAPIILTIIFDSRVGILATVTLALLVGLINGNNFEFVTATIVGCCLGLFSVRDIKKRSQFFFTTPGIVFLSYMVVIIAFSMTAFQGWDPLLNNLLFVVINAIFILFTYPFILLFEKTFNVTTDLTLIELSDTNLPLLKELMNKAPGTFHHSLQVANLAEAAAGAIHANGLLCRVAALYHDIGKMENPEYFSENQASFNVHDKLKPRMSALVIKAHVTNGAKMANENNLPDLVINFIQTHHGTSVIKFFYEKAKEHADNDRDEIREEDFRYDGPLPNTKETGIVMLADGVEAASRAMKDPNYQKLEHLIDKMFDHRVSEGQLSQTPLTFRDLSIIKETFLNILVGIYHSRVEYPDDEKEEDKEDTGRSVTSDKPHKSEEKEKQTDQPASRVNDYYNS